MSSTLKRVFATVFASAICLAASAQPAAILAVAGPSITTSALRNLQPMQRTVEYHSANASERDLTIAVCRTGRVAIASTQACTNAYAALSEEMLCNWQIQHDAPSSVTPACAKLRRQ